MPEVAVLPMGSGWGAVCSVHGVLAIWADRTMASWDAVGHATTHHT